MVRVTVGVRVRDKDRVRDSIYIYIYIYITDIFWPCSYDRTCIHNMYLVVGLGGIRLGILKSSHLVQRGHTICRPCIDDCLSNKTQRLGSGLMLCLVNVGALFATSVSDACR